MRPTKMLKTAQYFITKIITVPVIAHLFWFAEFWPALYDNKKYCHLS